MGYTVPSTRRIAYDIDGTVVGYNTGLDYTQGIQTWMTPANLQEMNDEDLNTVWSQGGYYGQSNLTTYNDRCIWWFFPEKRLITHALYQIYCAGDSGTTNTFYEFQGSNDSTNGYDGTWTSCTWPSGTPIFNSNPKDWWRTQIKPVTFDQAYRTYRVRIRNAYSTYWNSGYYYFYAIHLYGNKLAGETPDDILILDHENNVDAVSLVGASDADVEFTTDKNWGDRLEGTSRIDSILLRNSSSTKTANSIVLTLDDQNSADFQFSLDGTTWASTVTVASVAPETNSSPVYIKNTIGAPNQILGPRVARVIATVGSWS